MSGDDELMEVPVQAITLVEKGAPKYMILCDMPCKIIETRLKKKATNKGNDRVEVKGLHLWTGKKYEDTIVGTVSIQVPKWSTNEYTLLDVDASDGAVSLMDPAGGTKEDVTLVKDGKEWDPVSKDVIERFEAGEALIVTVFSCMGKEVVMQVRAEA
ncbi:unnamed protein product [Polarella glacialis]|uniref:Translation initiation factor 5A C-terminal domain-containing protein n=1 Tax=Polarella glacialis TaxID=89957 RepID=A0A813EL59_POLGL|nr:unnamed protein product [Polarella glacialis]CAE8601851.1 unnamed protein product [Polarella glacialis]CAE8649754.1 unnamed protein product [Polarella glacialis]CAE8682171.1 unnamed protein product [Polarella glacialis]|mmetsp:Transcript_1517/g.2314  ORF Transcript_1517/g.2314 Transcript_1517/m.2314 type:complete len:157 (-) Transcript_1517:55-525(-)